MHIPYMGLAARPAGRPSRAAWGGEVGLGGWGGSPARAAGRAHVRYMYLYMYMHMYMYI